MNSIQYNRILSCYAKDGQVTCISLAEQPTVSEALKADGWKHTMTIDPALWIPALLSSTKDDAFHMLDELQSGFSPAP